MKLKVILSGVIKSTTTKRGKQKEMRFTILIIIEHNFGIVVCGKGT